MTEKSPVLSLHSHNASSGPCVLCILNNAGNPSTKQCDRVVEDFIIKHKCKTNKLRLCRKP